MGLSSETVKQLLSDGRFYADPESNPERLDFAVRALESGWTIAQARTHGASAARAVKDAKLLARTRPNLLTMKDLDIVDS